MKMKNTIKNISLLSLVIIGGTTCQDSTSESNQRIPIPVQEKFYQEVSNSKLALPSGEKPMIYISGTDNDKGRIASVIDLLENYNVDCVTSDDCVPGEDVRSFIKRNLKKACICFVVLTSDYCNAIEEVGSTVSREYRQIYDELSTTPENTRIKPIFLGGEPRNIPRCLKNRQGIFLPKSHESWLANVRELIASLTINMGWLSINLQNEKISK